MNSMLKTLALVVTLGASALVAMPAQAGFSFDDDFDEICMTDYQIRTFFEDEGFDDIYLNVADEDGVLQVKAVEADGIYLIEFDSCERTIDDIEEL